MNLAEMIGGVSPTADVRLRQAKIVGAPAGGIATIRFADVAAAAAVTTNGVRVETGSTTADNISGVRHLAGAALADGDTVWVLQAGGALLIIGKVGGPIVGEVGQAFTSLEMRSTAANPFIDFTRTPGTADYDVRLINDVDNYLRVHGGRLQVTDDRVEAQNAFIGQSPPHGSVWAQFGNVNRLAAGDYCLMHHNTTGQTLLNTATGTALELRVNNSTVLSLNSGGFVLTGGLTMTGQIFITSGWIRSQTNGFGWYHEAGGGGWMMQDTTWLRAYGSRAILGTAQIRTGWAAGSNYTDRTMMMEGTNGAAGTSFWAHWSDGSGSAATNIYTHSTRGERIVCSTWNDGAHCPIAASAFEPNSTIREKKNIRPLGPSGKAKRRRLKPIRFNRTVRGSQCALCFATGRLSPAEFMERMYATPITDATPANLKKKVACPSCGHNGTPGHINTPAIDRNEDKDFFSFAAEDIAPEWPEAVVWEPSDPTDPMSEPIPRGLDLMAMVAIVAQHVAELDDRIDELEAKP